MIVSILSPCIYSLIAPDENTLIKILVEIAIQRDNRRIESLIVRSLVPSDLGITKELFNTLNIRGIAVQ